MEKKEVRIIMLKRVKFLPPKFTLTNEFVLVHKYIFMT